MTESTTQPGILAETKTGLENRKASGPIARALLYLLILTAVTAFGTLVYGLVQFPDAPVREYAEGFAGVRGYPYTRAQYETFLLGQRVLVATAPLTFVVAFVMDAVDRWERKRRP